MGKSSGGGSGSTINPAILNMIQGNYASAQNVANTPYQPYTGQMVAGLTQPQQQAGGAYDALLNTGLGAGGSGDFSAAGSILQGAANPNAISSQISNYQNPFTQQVANTTMQQLGQYNQNQLANNASSATMSGAFGGDRLGVQDALTNQLYGQTAASTLANLNSQGFNAALGAAQTGNQQGIQAGGILGNVGNQQISQYGQAANSLLGYGNTAQQTAQAGLTAPYQQYLAAQQWPITMQNLLNSSELGGASASQSPNQLTSSMLGGLGGLLGGVNSLGSASGIFGAGGLLGGLFA